MGVSVKPPVIRRLRKQIQRLEGTTLPARTVLSFGLEAIDACRWRGWLSGRCTKFAGGDDTTIDGPAAANLSTGVAICLYLDYV